MKKKILSIAVIVALAVTAGWNFSQNRNEVELSNLGLANVEALAREELPEITITCSRSCKDGVGQCYKWSYLNSSCIYTGYQYNHCSCN